VFIRATFLVFWEVRRADIIGALDSFFSTPLGQDAVTKKKRNKLWSVVGRGLCTPFSVQHAGVSVPCYSNFHGCCF
jgi:hypothetical protein